MRSSISIIIPVYNEKENLAPLVASLVTHCSQLVKEFVFVDDGSSDGTSEELARLQYSQNQMKILTLKRNFGQTAAIAAGIDHTEGDIIVTMDGDGQNDPADIPMLIKKIEEGYDVVSGWRKVRKDSFLTRIVPSIVANTVISVVTGIRLHDYGCTLKAYRRNIIANLQLAGEMHRFLPAWCVWQGGKVAEVAVSHHPRTHGQSKYGLLRIFKVIIDLMTVKFFSGYLFKPNYLFSGSGFLMFLLGGVSALIAIVDKFGPDSFPKFRIPLLLLAVCLWLIGVSLVLMGLLAELIVRLYFQILHQKPYRLKNE